MNHQISVENAAHRDATSGEIDYIATRLQEALGQKLTAYMADVDSPQTVGRWASGDRHPREDQDRRLRAIFQIFQMLITEESSHTIRAWFMGLNPQLNDESPASVIKDDRLREALVAAKVYLNGG